MSLKEFFYAGISVCCGGGLIIVYSLHNLNTEKFKVNAEDRTTEFRSWDYNWDKRQPEYNVRPLMGTEDKARYDKQVAMVTPRATRNIILVRHGHYNLQGQNDAGKCLSLLGREQVALTSKRLKELGLGYTHLAVSTMQRAKQTACSIKQILHPDVHIDEDLLLDDGTPISSEPWSSPRMYHSDTMRIEAAFRKYFHRAEPGQKEDTYEIIVSHSNVLRYFLCRVLQFPPEAWIRFALYHSSISMIAILPSGRVELYSIGDTGHLPPSKLTK